MFRSLSPLSALLALGLAVGSPTISAAEALKVAVIGGIQMCGIWDKLAPKIEKATGVPIDMTAAAPKTQIIPEFRRGNADLLLIHGGSETFALQAEGIGGQQRVWSFNEHAIIGPQNDPAGVALAGSAEQAFRAIAEQRSPFVAFRDPGSHEMVQNLWKRMRLQASSAWVLLDETAQPQEILEFTAKHQAYVVVGAIPAAFEKMRGEGLKILLKGDPAMRRAFVVMEPGARHPAGPEAREQARKVADFLTSPAGQAALVEANREAGGPWLFPLKDSVPQVTPGPGGGRGRRAAQESN